MNNLIKEEKFEIKDFIRRLIKRDFSGTKGLVIKNSFYQIATNLVTKVGSLLFTIVLVNAWIARNILGLEGALLSKELFGLYTLALSTIIIFSSFTDLGLGSTLIRFASQNSKKRIAYLKYIVKLKFYLSFGISLILIGSSYFISKYYYQKPIMLALMAGGIYIIFNNFSGILSTYFQSQNNFKFPFYKEIIFQISRLILVPLAVLSFISNFQENISLIIILTLSFAYLISGLFFINKISREKSKITKKDKSQIWKFTLPLSVMVLSGIFFGYIDMIMLGRFVSSEFIAYYQVAFALVTSSMVIFSFGGVLLPIFSRLSKEKLEEGLHKSILFTVSFSLIGIILLLFLAEIGIKLIYGVEYLDAANILRILSLILITDPLIGIFVSYYISKGKNKKVAITVILSTILNISLNLFFIYLFMKKGMFAISYGVAIATVISRFVYLFSLTIGRKN